MLRHTKMKIKYAYPDAVMLCSEQNQNQNQKSFNVPQTGKFVKNLKGDSFRFYVWYSLRCVCFVLAVYASKYAITGAQRNQAGEILAYQIRVLSAAAAEFKLSRWCS